MSSAPLIVSHQLCLQRLGRLPEDHKFITYWPDALRKAMLGWQQAEGLPMTGSTFDPGHPARLPAGHTYQHIFGQWALVPTRDKGFVRRLSEVCLALRDEQEAQVALIAKRPLSQIDTKLWKERHQLLSQPEVEERKVLHVEVVGDVSSEQLTQLAETFMSADIPTPPEVEERKVLHVEVGDELSPEHAAAVVKLFQSAEISPPPEEQAVLEVDVAVSQSLLSAAFHPTTPPATPVEVATPPATPAFRVMPPVLKAPQQHQKGKGNRK